MNCILREMNESDLSMVLTWRNAEDIRNNMYTNHVISVDEHRSWWESHKNNPKMRRLVCELDGCAAGVVIFTNYMGPEGVASWAFYSGDRTRRGVGTAMEVAALHYAFDTLRVRRLECEVLDFNDSVIRFHLKHGFRVEGIFLEAYVRDGKPHDVYKFAMLARDWFKVIKLTIEARASGTSTETDYTGKKFSQIVNINDESVALFAKAVQDHNPIHFDSNAAKQLGFEGRISHGLLAGSLFSGFFAREFPGPGTIYLGQTLEFSSPIIVGTTVELRMRVLSHIGRKLLLETQVFAGDVLCVSGQANLLMPI